MKKVDEQDWKRKFIVPENPTTPIEIEDSLFTFSLNLRHCGLGQFPLTFTQCMFRERVRIATKPPDTGTLTKPISFSHCIFKRSLSLVHLIASNKVMFEACLFEDYADFSHTHFKSSVSFHDSIFKKKAYFQGTHFKASAHFTEADFLDGSDFNNAHFAGLTTFEKATFGGATTFSNPQFYRVPPIDDPQFIFRSSQIFGFVGFRSEPETPETFPKIFQLNVNDDSAISADFRNIYIQSSRGLRFHSANLMKIRFELPPISWTPV